MDIVDVLLVLLVGAAVLAYLASDGTALSLDTFAAGFLPYRGPGWPQGVQEEDPVPWSWSSAGGSDPLGDGSTTGADGPEIVEISGADAPSATAVAPGRSVRAARRL